MRLFLMSTEVDGRKEVRYLGLNACSTKGTQVSDGGAKFG